MKKTNTIPIFLLIMLVCGCIQSSPTSHTLATSMQKTISSPNISTYTATLSTLMPKERIKDFKVTAKWKKESNVLVLYLEVKNQTACTKIDGKLKITIKDEFGILIYNGTLTVHRSDFLSYSEELTNVSGNLTEPTVYKARYVLTNFQKGISSSGIIDATLITKDTMLKKVFKAQNLPKMSEKERMQYFEKVYLRNSKPLNVTQKKANIILEVYRYGIYVHPLTLKKYLRIDTKIKNLGNNSVELMIREPAKLTVDGFSVTEYPKDISSIKSKKLEPGKDITEEFLFPMEEISLEGREFILEVHETEMFPEREAEIMLPKLKFSLNYTLVNISKPAEKFPIEITLMKYAVFEYETPEGKEEGVKVLLKIKNTGDNEVKIDLNGITLGGEVKIAPFTWFLTVGPHSEKQTWLLFPYVQGKTTLTVHLYDLTELKDELIEIPFEIKGTPRTREIKINKTIEEYPLKITIEKVEEIPYLEITKLKSLVKIYLTLENTGETALPLNIEQWGLLTSKGVLIPGDVVMSNLTNAIELTPGNCVSGYVVFKDIPEDVQYILKIKIPNALRTIEFKVKLPIRLGE
ncbi:DUF4352 domain-containing protein [Thermococcus barophilus]|uniref:DUF4352 domain-containing protein n=1 Tax=Thermococcus barophilus TaxID=55802 RepID=A0A0S1XAJ8_THEBA|nr:DUF4352 domain-containing protein [Thermococcus barophilus]ALM74791.1 conserved exported hypothetical protein [Thermococcus barophilus]